MDEDVLVQELVNRLTFEVETLTDKVVKFPNTNGTPLNVKVRVRNKDEPKLVQRGIITLPRPGNQITVPERIQLIGSDQTILSFNVFMEATSSKESTPKRPKHGFHFFKFGGCLGTSYDEDNGPYLPSTSNKDALRCRKGKSDSLIMDEVKDLPETPKMNAVPQNQKDQKGLFGKCKPGGCLDPPFGEDKYPYTIPQVQPRKNLNPQETIDRKEDNNVIISGIEPKQTPKEADEFSKTVSKLNKNETEPKPLLNIFPRTGEEHSLVSNYSNSIITYPSGLTSSKTQNNDQGIEKKIKNRSFDSGSPRQSFEYTETYFIPPKDILRHREEERKYSREHSNHKIKTNDDNRHKDDLKHGGATFDKNRLNKGIKVTENIAGAINRLQDKGKPHQESTTYLTNKDILRCGENDDIDETSESVYKKTTESPKSINGKNIIITPESKEAVPDFFTDSINEDKALSKEENVKMQVVSASHIPITEAAMASDKYLNKSSLRCGENEDDVYETLESVYPKTTESPKSINGKNIIISPDSKEAAPDFFTDSINADKALSKESNVKMQVVSASNIPITEAAMAPDKYLNKSSLRCGENEDDIDDISESVDPNTSEPLDPVNTNTCSNPKEAVLFADSINIDNVVSNEKNLPIQVMPPSNISTSHLLTETVQDSYPNKSILRCGENEDVICETSESITKSKSSGLKEITSTTNAIPKTNEDLKAQEKSYRDGKASEKGTVADSVNTNIDQVLPTSIEKLDINQIKHDNLSRDSIISENKDFATSSVDSIGSTENLGSTNDKTKTENEVLDNQMENVYKKVLPLNVGNVIIQNDTLKEERSSVIFQKTPFIATDEPIIYHDQINKINPFRRNTFTTIESKTSLQKHIDEISSQRNVTDIDSQVKAGNESVLVDSTVTERLNASIRIKNSDSAINVSQNAKETDSLLLTPSFDKSTTDNSEVNTSHVDSNTNIIPTDRASQLHDTGDAFDISNSTKLEFDTSYVAKSTKDANDPISDTQFITAKDHAVVNNDLYAEYGSQLSTISVGNIDIPPESLTKLDHLTEKTISSVQSITNSSDSLKKKGVVQAKFSLVDDNTLNSDSIIQHDTLNQNILHPKTTEKCDKILLNLSFQSYINDNNERVVQTLNPLVKPQPRFMDDTVTAIQSLIRHGNEIRIPVDPQNDLILNFYNKNEEPEDANIHKNEVVKEHLQSKNAEVTRPATHTADIVNKNLAVVYENELIPLHSVIKDLTEEINALLVQRELLKAKLRSTKRSRSLRLIPVNNRCGCRRT